MSLQQTIENIWDNRDLLQNEDSQKAIREVISLVDKGNFVQQSLLKTDGR